jgi:predicted secreted protein
MATTVKLGKEFVIMYNSKPITRCTDFDFEVNKQTVDITTLDSNGWRELMVDMKEWRINFNGLVTRGADTATNYDYDTLLDEILDSDDAVEVAVKGTTGDSYEKGNGFITSLKMSGSVGDKVTYSGTLEGTGELTTATA